MTSDIGHRPDGQQVWDTLLGGMERVDRRLGGIHMITSGTSIQFLRNTITSLSINSSILEKSTYLGRVLQGSSHGSGSRVVLDVYKEL